MLPFGCILLVFVKLFDVTNSLQCYTCVNAPTHDACTVSGQLVTCQANENSCATEIRWISTGRRQQITKRCKQVQACFNNRNVETCKARSPNAMCYCCCVEDRCNVDGLHCTDEQSSEKKIGDVPQASKCFPAFKSTRHESVRCTNQNYVGSRCAMVCGRGYVNGKLKTAFCQKNGRWRNSLSQCSPIKCPANNLKLPNGVVRCSKTNTFGSICRFVCKPGYQRRGTTRSICLPNWKNLSRGRWSHAKPTCTAVQRTCPATHPVPNSHVECTNNTQTGSECQYNCVDGYDLIGPYLITCQDNGSRSFPTWSENPPECRKTPQCQAVNIGKNLDVECGSKILVVGTTCRFSCRGDSTLNGPNSVTCVQNRFGELAWDESPPSCKDICPGLSQRDHLDIKCSDGNSQGSVCKFKCGKYYDLIGRESITCRESGSGKKQWDFVEPTCLKRCPALEEPRHGKLMCSNNRYIGTQCNFICDETYDLIGAAMTSCVAGPSGEAIWDQGVPYCRKQRCPEIPQVPKGTWSCTDGNIVGSTCNFTCSTHYKALPLHSKHRICQKENLEWNNPTPCCSRICPLSPNIDLVIALDSSSSVGKRGWTIMIEFLQELVSLYNFSENTTCVAVFRYNKFIDKRNVIPFNYVKIHGKEALLRKIATIPYDGSGTNTGKALEFAGQTMFSPHDGDRDHSANVLIILTDGRSNDNVVQPSQTLRDKHVLTYVVGIQSVKGKLDVDQLQSIAGRPQNLFLTSNGYEGLGRNFAKELAQSLCPNTCTA